MTDPGPPQYSTRYKLTVAAIVALAGVLFGLAAFSADTGEPGDDVAVPGDGEGPIVEQTTPPDGAEALRQTEITIDLAAGYDGRLVINGVPVPEEELRKEANLYQVTFVPGEGKAIEELSSGRTCVIAIFWKLSDSEGGPSTNTHRWCFDVT